MTKDEILTMEPGPELDALVAKTIFGFLPPTHELPLSKWWTPVFENDRIKMGQVIGWRNEKRKKASNDEFNRSFHWRTAEGEPAVLLTWSTDISAAWRLVEKLGKEADIQILFDNREWACLVINEEGFSEGNGAMAPEAICKAALVLHLEAAKLIAEDDHV